MSDLHSLKRKQLIALCRKKDIKCVGTNAELIEKLLALEQNQGDQTGFGKTDEVEEEEACTAEVDEVDAVREDETAAEEPAEVGPCQEEEIPDYGIDAFGEESKPNDKEKLTIVEFTASESFRSVSEEPAPVRTVADYMEGSKSSFEQATLQETVPSVAECDAPLSTPKKEELRQERRTSVRLSAAHLKKGNELKPSLPAKSSLKTSFLPRPSTGAKENRPAPDFKQNISHIPTLKERVSAMAVTAKRTAVQRSEPAKKQKFDLKQSLSRPLSYKPYTGPVKKCP